MKRLILILVSVLLLISTLTSNAFCQVTENITQVALDPLLQLKLNDIDKYVKKIDSGKLFLVGGLEGEMTNGGNIEN